MTGRKRGKRKVGRYTRWAPTLQRGGRKPTAGTLSTPPTTPILSMVSADCPLKPSQQPELPSVNAGIWVTLNSHPASVLWKLPWLPYRLWAPRSSLHSVCGTHPLKAPVSFPLYIYFFGRFYSFWFHLSFWGCDYAPLPQCQCFSTSAAVTVISTAAEISTWQYPKSFCLILSENQS